MASICKYFIKGHIYHISDSITSNILCVCLCLWVFFLPILVDMLLSGNLTLLWKMTIFSGKIHYKWPFSIAMLNYQRVSPSNLMGKLFTATSIRVRFGWKSSLELQQNTNQWPFSLDPKMGIYTQNMAWKMVLTYLHFRILEFPWKIPLIKISSLFRRCELMGSKKPERRLTLLPPPVHGRSVEFEAP